LTRMRRLSLAHRVEKALGRWALEWNNSASADEVTEALDDEYGGLKKLGRHSRAAERSWQLMFDFVCYIRLKNRGKANWTTTVEQLAEELNVEARSVVRAYSRAKKRETST